MTIKDIDSMRFQGSDGPHTSPCAKESTGRWPDRMRPSDSWSQPYGQGALSLTRGFALASNLRPVCGVSCGQNEPGVSPNHMASHKKVPASPPHVANEGIPQSGKRSQECLFTEVLFKSGTEQGSHLAFGWSHGFLKPNYHMAYVRFLSKWLYFYPRYQN